MNKNFGYLITAIVSGIAGWFVYTATHKSTSDQAAKNFGATTVELKDGKYFLVFDGAIKLSREITQEEYNAFIGQYPTGVAPSNILSRFSSNTPKYTMKEGKYYEQTWDGTTYGRAIEITPEEYGFLTNKLILDRFAI